MGVNSGITLSQESFDAHAKVFSKAAQYCILQFNADFTQVVPAYISEKEATFEDLKSKIDKTQAQYMFYNISYQTKNGQPRDKVCFMTLCSDDHVFGKGKMLCASTKDMVKNKLQSSGMVQVNDMDDFTVDNFIESFRDS